MCLAYYKGVKRVALKEALYKHYKNPDQKKHLQYRKS